MSATSTRNPLAPVEQKDIRAASLPFKHDKDRREKWSNGARPSAGVRLDLRELSAVASTAGHKVRVRPNKQWSQLPSEPKSHANKNPKPCGSYDGRSRLAHKAEAVLEAKDHTSATLSKSLLDLLPQHSNNTESAIHMALRESAGAADAEILYSFDNKGPSPGNQGRKVDLGGLVDRAERRFLSEQTDKIVKGEYEVLDNDGETTVIRRGGKGGKKSPKQAAIKPAPPSQPTTTETSNLDEDDFELV
ncbi:hypothetical protein PZA11_006963 [Diplocarpon coronariae]|uniref:Uncharacterized protein n=1 Tax=Diplocarpon coronariae TaxID=2795749 RepID=A0A218YXJ0_9HELO|nr:hypothetical protein JHW43_003404 [Diplocarpon mali]OWP00070.1 hypothetical protein B2J93_8641 [Marssonina coronariae]